MAFVKSRRKASFKSMSIISQLLVLTTLLAAPVAGVWDEWRRPEQAPILPFVPSNPSTPPLREQRFTLRHVVHRGTKLYPDLHRRLDVNPEKAKQAAELKEPGDNGVGPYGVRASTVQIPRLQQRARSAEYMLPLMRESQTHGIRPTFPDAAWSLDEVASPNMTDKGTVVNFALMAGSAYNKDKSDPEWEDTRPPFNLSSDVGWEKDGIRGHVFADDNNSTIVIAIKGTSMAVFDGAETTTSDKENDNLFAGCCCGQGGSYLLRQVCDCMTSAYTCNDTCVTKALRKPNRYYHSSLELYGNITEMYPDASVWITGHSLGGLVASLVGMTFGIPAVTFEAVPQALAAERLSLPVPPGYSSIREARKQSIFNFGHTADPVYMGTCNGGTSLCSIGGYALETQCHAGLRCVYDVVDDRKWRVSLSSHGIRGCIKNVYKDYDTVPECVPDDECVDCFNWKRFHSNGSDATTSSTSSTSVSTSTMTTRTSTCQTPGWWGCRDDTSTTTSVSSTSTSTTTMTTTTCSSYGWFGNCLDPITTTTISTTTLAPPPTTTTTTTASRTSSSTETCESPGWWGCKDKPTTTTTGEHAITSPPKAYELR